MYGGVPYAGAPYAGALMDEGDIPVDIDTHLSVEVAFTTGALEEPVWVDVTADVRAWDTKRGRSRELERMQPGRATIVLANRERQYDSHHATGPHYGNLRPMRRVRIRETFNGVTYPIFDGSVDGWHLNYPGAGLDATATIIATDAFKIFGRADLPRSVYDDEVLADSPVIYWRLDETKADESVAALNAGTLGVAGNGTYVGPVKSRGEQGLVALDPGTSIQVQDPGGLVAVPDMGVMIADTSFDISDTGSWAIEFWVIPAGEPIGTDQWVHGENPAGNARLVIQSSSTAVWQFRIVRSDDLAEYGVSGNAADQVANTRYHIVAKYGPNKTMTIYVNGTAYTAALAGTTAPPLVGSVHADMDLGFLYTFGDGQTPEAFASNFAVYTSAEGVDPLSDARVLVHYESGTHPWQDDQPAGRAGRVLDMVDWPAGWRELDTGNVALQSAEVNGQTALEHLQKVAETEFGLLFMSRDGNVRLVGREAMFGREPDLAVFGDGVGEVGYRSVTFDDGDTTVRNRATISRLNGVAKTSVDAASVTEFGRFDYALEGLLHRSDSYSLDYANLVTGEYAEPRRRVTSLALGPPDADADATLLPQMLGRELGDAVVVKDTPLGGGDRFEQTCVIEGVTHQWDPHAGRTASWVLSPEFSVRAFEEEDVATLGYARVVVAQSGITSTEVDLTGLTVDVVVGANRYIKITANCPHFRSAADGLTRYSIHEGAAKLQFADVFQRAVEGGSLLCNFSVVLQAPSAGAHTYKLRGDIVTGTGTAQLNATTESPAFILVEDIGPV